eukprot:jgi/Botrbrau1/13533/Bobra.0347s0017.1
MGQISDRGARALGKLLSGASVIRILNLKDNVIHAEGGRCLARALRTNQVLQQLVLRLNQLGEEGGTAICESSALQLHIEAARRGSAGQALAEGLHGNASLTDVDVSCNPLGPDVSASLRVGLESNWALQSLEVGLRLSPAIASALRSCSFDLDTKVKQKCSLYLH